MKFDEIENINLNGYKCYYKEQNKKGKFVYYLQKEINRFKYTGIKCLIENIEFQTLYNLTDTKLK